MIAEKRKLFFSFLSFPFVVCAAASHKLQR